MARHFQKVGIIHMRLTEFDRWRLSRLASLDERSLTGFTELFVHRALGAPSMDEITAWRDHCIENDLTPERHMRAYAEMLQEIDPALDLEADFDPDDPRDMPMERPPMPSMVAENIDPDSLNPELLEEWIAVAPVDRVAAFAWKKPGDACPHCGKVNDPVRGMECVTIIRTRDGVDMWRCDACGTDQARYARDLQKARDEDGTNVPEEDVAVEK